VRRALTLSAALTLATALGGCGITSSSPTATIRNLADSGPSISSALSLIIEPQAGIAPVLRAIRGARRLVELVMYEDEDGQVDAALAAARARGVNVRVLLNGGYTLADNRPAYRYLETHRVAVRWTPSYFALTHQKSLVVDGRAYILTFNLTPRYYASDRDFGVVDINTVDVAAIERTFAADWTRTKIAAPAGRDLIWSPGSQQALISLIESARGSLDIYNEEMDSGPIEGALESASRRGVDVRVVMTYDSDWRDAFERLTAAGVHVRTFASDAPLYIHAKMILTPRRAFIGSENFSYTSLQLNRELGIMFTTPTLIRSLSATFDRDYAQASPYTG
jgi:phosphatidylserine/phosphatidylglycerophosphate/cardiolipin synthase-like enzyme